MERGDGGLYITINDMGHGDGTIISLPNGKTILIDFGSSRSDRNFWADQGRQRTSQELIDQTINNLLGDPRYLLNSRTIDVVILTHSDRDHHNYISRLFQSGGLTARRLFFSGDFSGYYQGTAGSTNLLMAARVPNLYSITINAHGASYKKLRGYHRGNAEYDPEVKVTERPTEQISPDEFIQEESIQEPEDDLTRGFVKILDGTPNSGERVSCGFYLLASNVSTDDETAESTPVNRGSIVSMIVLGEGADAKRFLFLGDATFTTERFLRDAYGDGIANVELVQVGHHGSTTSSDEPFVRLINPRIAVVSASYRSGNQLGLPRLEVLQRFAQVGGSLKVRDTEGKIACYGLSRTTDDKLIKRVSEGIVSDDERPSKKLKTGANKKVPKYRTSQSLKVETEFTTTKSIWCTGSDGPIDYPHPLPPLEIPPGGYDF